MKAEKAESKDLEDLAQQLKEDYDHDEWLLSALLPDRSLSNWLSEVLSQDSFLSII